MNFDLTPSRDQKIEFPATAEGHIRRVVFYAGAAIAALCGIAILGTVIVAVFKVGWQLLHLR